MYGETASFVKGRQRGTWCAITPATRAHGVRRSHTVLVKGWAGGLKGRLMSDDIMTDGNVSVCFSYVGIRNEGAVVERVSFRCALSRSARSGAMPKFRVIIDHPGPITSRVRCAQEGGRGSIAGG